ncbi:hypothetical protein [Prevotella corporis]|uniref:hypothetical protein n=1 Tax=Prevotella corporis TaxID=28128 RepID=UPI000420503D|nr:hypothetical protein [Prevotella corporis]
MELAEVKKTIEDLKGRFDAPFGSSDKTTIENLYYEVIGKTFVPTSCQQCYHDGLIEIYHYIKNNGKMAEKLNYRLKAGAIINCPAFMSGKVFSNDNLTDDVAEKFLKQFPDNVELFQKVPKASGAGKGKVPKKDATGAGTGEDK